jgi:hypothetical protein
VAERRSFLERVESERLVAEEDVVGATRRGEPGGGAVPRILANCGLAAVHPRSPVPAPRDFCREQECHPKGEAGERPGAGERRQPQEAGCDEHGEERQGEDEVTALERDAAA